MKMVICFDTEDRQGMENSIAMMDHLAKEYMHRRIETTDSISFSKIEFIKMMRTYAANIADEMGLTDPSLLTEGQTTREKEDWEGLRFNKEFADKVFAAKRGNKRLGSSEAPMSLIRK